MGCGSAMFVMRLCGSVLLRAGVLGSVKTIGGQVLAGQPCLRFTGRDFISRLFLLVNDASDSEGIDALGVASVR